MEVTVLKLLVLLALTPLALAEGTGHDDEIFGAKLTDGNTNCDGIVEIYVNIGKQRICGIGEHIAESLCQLSKCGGLQQIQKVPPSDLNSLSVLCTGEEVSLKECQLSMETQSSCTDHHNRIVCGVPDESQQVVDDSAEIAKKKAYLLEELENCTKLLKNSDLEEQQKNMFLQEAEKVQKFVEHNKVNENVLSIWTEAVETCKTRFQPRNNPDFGDQESNEPSASS